MNTKKLTISAMFVAIGVVAGNVIYIPVGAAKCFPVQHTINILSAVMLGPGYAVLNAFCISLLRNVLQTGSLLAFPGSMIGAFIAGMVYKHTKNKYFCALGEVFGTGILGGLVAFPIALLVMGKKTGAFVYVFSFLISTIGGSLIGLIILKSSVLLKLGEKYNNRG